MARNLIVAQVAEPLRPFFVITFLSLVDINDFFMPSCLRECVITASHSFHHIVLE